MNCGSGGYDSAVTPRAADQKAVARSASALGASIRTAYTRLLCMHGKLPRRAHGQSRRAEPLDFLNFAFDPGEVGQGRRQVRSGTSLRGMEGE
ncbi:hypothetical protein GCM10009680_69970 [Streptomyces yatensis]|uniref:Uncharacterized protein n=1 Tax=Streptomyces yatensis TaxID=155177 RepID=A0ABP4V6J3_9ACTN